LISSRDLSGPLARKRLKLTPAQAIVLNKKFFDLVDQMRAQILERLYIVMRLSISCHGY
jgi:hypothetical protein